MRCLPWGCLRNERVAPEADVGSCFRRLRALPFLLSALIAAAVATPASAQSLEISGGEPGPRSASIETFTARATVESGVALVDLDQTFRNESDIVREGVWSIRLPDDAVVHSFSMWMEGKEKKGRVHESGVARRTYDSIVQKRRDPALLEEVGWRTFRVSVFPIPARDTVRVRLVYAHVVPDDLGLHSLRIPLPAERVGAVDVSVDVAAPGGLGACDAPSAVGAKIALREDGATVRWSAEGLRPAGPFEARFAPAAKGFGLSLLAHREAGDPQGSFVARIVPRLDAPPELPRDVVFVLDRSGSMQGRKIEQARAALVHGLGTLRPADRFAVVSFSTDVAAEPLVAADAEHVEAAKKAAALIDATGGTNLEGALRAAVALRREDPERMFVVVLMTDGAPTVGETNPERIVARWRDAGGEKIRLFALGVGDDVKDFLLTRLARGSRGAAEYVRQEERLEAKLSSLFEKVRAPLLTDPEISVEGVPVVSVEPRPLPDVFRGGAVVLAGRFVEGGKATLVLRGKQGAKGVEVRVPVEFPTAPTARPHVAQLWARMRIDRLLDDLRNAGDSAEIRGEITALGLRHQVVSPYTSFLVVEDGVRIADERETARVPEGPAPADPGATASGPTTGGGGGPTTGGAPATGGGGHVGSYRGGAGEVPPDSREPSDPPPPPEGDGPATPGGDTGGGPTVGGGGAPPPSGGGGGGAPTGSAAHALGGNGSPLTVDRGRRSGYEDWRFWWDYEADALLADALPAPAAPLDPAIVQGRILPALRRTFDDPNLSPLLHAEALEALLRFGCRDAAFLDRVAALQRAGAAAKDPAAHPHVAERALLAPVWLGDRSEATRERLISVVADELRPARERGFAALALGLLGERADGRVAQALLAARNRPGDQTVIPACLFAAGLLGDPSATAALHARLQQPGDELEAAYVVDAIGRIGSVGTAEGAGRSAVVRTLLAFAADEKGTSTHVQRLLPRALARLFAGACEADRAAVLDALRRLAEDADDPSTRGAAMLALGSGIL